MHKENETYDSTEVVDLCLFFLFTCLLSRREIKFENILFLTEFVNFAEFFIIILDLGSEIRKNTQ